MKRMMLVAFAVIALVGLTVGPWEWEHPCQSDAHSAARRVGCPQGVEVRQ